MRLSGRRRTNRASHKEAKFVPSTAPMWGRECNRPAVGDDIGAPRVKPRNPHRARRRQAGVLLIGAVLSIIISLCCTPSEAIDELAGIKLRCCALEEHPYTDRDRTNQRYGNWSGLAIDYLRLLQDRLGFVCETVTEYAPEDPELQGFSGFVENFARCAVNGDSSNCECDLGVGSWAMSSKRFPKVDFIAPLSDENFRMITRTSLVRGSAQKSVFFLQAFTWQVWLGVISLVFLHIFVTLFDRNFAPAPPMTEIPRGVFSGVQRLRHRLLKSKLLYRVRQAAFNSSFHFVGQATSSETHKSGTKEKTMNLIAIFFGVVLLTCFQASVTVQVLLEKPTSEFHSLEDIKSCRIHAQRVCVTGNGAAENFWREAVEPSVCIARDETAQPKIVSSFVEGFDNVLDGTCDYFYTLGGQILSQSNGRYCNRLTAVGKGFFETNVAFVLPKNSTLTAPMSVETLLLREQDKLLSSKQFAEQKDCPDVTDTTLNWSKLGSFFYIAYAGLGVMLIVMILDPSRKLPENELQVRPQDATIRDVQTGVDDFKEASDPEAGMKQPRSPTVYGSSPFQPP